MMKMSAVSIGRKLLADWFFLVAFSMVHGLRFFFFFFSHTLRSSSVGRMLGVQRLSASDEGSSQLLVLRRRLSFYVLNEGSKRREKGSKAIQHGTLVICSNAIWPRRQYPPRVRTKSEGQQNCQKRLRNDLLLAGFCSHWRANETWLDGNEICFACLTREKEELPCSRLLPLHHSS